MTCAHQQMNHWLAEFNSLHGVIMVLDCEGYCRMKSEDGFEITILAPLSEETFRVFIDIKPMPLTGQLSIYQACLKMNLDQGMTAGASISIDEQAHSIVLSYIREVDGTTFTQFSNVLQNLLVVADKAKTALCNEELKTIDENLNVVGSMVLV